MKLYSVVAGLVALTALLWGFLAFETGRDFGEADAVIWYDKYEPVIVVPD